MWAEYTLILYLSLDYCWQINGSDLSSQLQVLAVTTDHKPLPSMEDQLSRSRMWCSNVVYSCPLSALALGFPGGAGQGQPPPVFCPGPTCLSYEAI